jgi:hypothetical protein
LILDRIEQLRRYWQHLFALHHSPMTLRDKPPSSRFPNLVSQRVLSSEISSSYSGTTTPSYHYSQRDLKAIARASLNPTTLSFPNEKRQPSSYSRPHLESGTWSLAPLERLEYSDVFPQGLPPFALSMATPRHKFSELNFPNNCERFSFQVPERTSTLSLSSSQ